LAAWLAAYRARLKRECSSDSLRQRNMDRVNPKYVLRTWIAQRAITAAQQGDVAPLNETFDLLARPFDEQPGREVLALPAPPDARGVELSCSS
jgi:hypothetical protein